MQEIEFYCKNCKKSMKMAYRLSGDLQAPVMTGMMIRCHTNIMYKSCNAQEIYRRANNSQSRCSWQMLFIVFIGCRQLHNKDN